MTKAVPASPTLAYLIPGGAFASGQGYYVDRSPRGLLRQLVHRGALCRTGVSWLQPPHPTPNPEAAVRPARSPCGQAMLSRWIILALILSPRHLNFADRIRGIAVNSCGTSSVA